MIKNILLILSILLGLNEENCHDEDKKNFVWESIKDVLYELENDDPLFFEEIYATLKEIITSDAKDEFFSLSNDYGISTEEATEQFNSYSKRADEPSSNLH